MSSQPDADMTHFPPDEGTPVSVKIRERIIAARKRFNANDNIAEFIQPGELEKLLDEVEVKMQGVLDSLVIHTEGDHNTQATARRAALRDGLILVLMVLGAAGTLALALRPLARLAQGVQDRSPEDMTPIPPQDLPADIRPLVSAVNQHMARNQALITQQREFLDDASH